MQKDRPVLETGKSGIEAAVRWMGEAQFKVAKKSEPGHEQPNAQARENEVWPAIRLVHDAGLNFQMMLTLST